MSSIYGNKQEIETPKAAANAGGNSVQTSVDRWPDGEPSPQAASGDVGGIQETLLEEDFLTQWRESAFPEKVRKAIGFVDKIVVESDGYPVLFSAKTLRTLLVNAFISGMDASNER